MLTKILAASALTIGMATAAVAQSASENGSGQPVQVDPQMPNANSNANDGTIDYGTTQSTTGTMGTTDTENGVVKTPNQDCANTPQGSASPELNSQADLNVNGHHCDN